MAPMEKPFRWVPCHATQNLPNLGHIITTLNINIEVDDAEWRDLCMAPNPGFKPVLGQVPQVCLAGGSLVFCRGLVAGVCPQGPERLDREAKVTSACISHLPEGLRPARPLYFAAVSRDRADELVALAVWPDGSIQGFGRGQAAGVIDLSAVRFSVDRGISLVDQVRMHTCDFGGLRMVMLQGHLVTRSFKVHSETRLALLPKPCRPQRDETFVVPGARAGNFHLVLVQPSRAYGVGGEITWGDALWRCNDEISLSGVIYTAGAEALQLSLDTSQIGHNRQIIIISEFQDYIRRKHGTIERAWHQAFDIDNSGTINFTEFSLGCKKSGYTGNVGRIWSLLDKDQSGEISQDELAMEAGDLELTRKGF